MKAQVRICGSLVLKRFAAPEMAATAQRRARLARSAGVNTPDAALLRSGRTAVFPRIEGRSGRAAIAPREGEGLTVMMRQVVELHGLTPVGGIEDFDPLQKILPRLTETLRPVLSPILEAARGVIGRMPSLRRVMHGDLHAGQFIMGADDKAWLLDLDDLAIGDPAADLGNFCAHAATSNQGPQEDSLHMMRRWLTITRAAYQAAGGITINAELAEAYGRIALVRRALKAFEKGDATLLWHLQRQP